MIACVRDLNFPFASMVEGDGNKVHTVPLALVYDVFFSVDNKERVGSNSYLGYLQNVGGRTPHEDSLVTYVCL